MEKNICDDQVLNLTLIICIIQKALHGTPQVESSCLQYVTLHRCLTAPYAPPTVTVKYRDKTRIGLTNLSKAQTLVSWPRLGPSFP